MIHIWLKFHLVESCEHSFQWHLIFLVFVYFWHLETSLVIFSKTLLVFDVLKTAMWIPRPRCCISKIILDGILFSLVWNEVWCHFVAMVTQILVKCSLLDWLWYCSSRSKLNSIVTQKSDRATLITSPMIIGEISVPLLHRQNYQANDHQQQSSSVWSVLFV